MSKQQILKFAVATGNPPLVDDKATKDTLIEKFKHLHKLKQEELDEQLEALEAGNLLEYFDGILDEYVYMTQEIIQLESAGFKVNEGLNAVCINNANKYTTSLDYIYNQHARLVQRDGVNDWYVDSNEYDGGLHHCIKHHDTNKVTKWVDHEKVDLRPFVPKQYQLFYQLHDTLPDGDIVNDIKSEPEYDELVATGLGEVIYKDFPKSYEELIEHQEV